MTEFYTSKEDIEIWLINMRIKNFDVKEDKTYGFVVDIDGGLYLNNKGLPNFPVKFGLVRGDFHCYQNAITSLDFAPHTVEGSFVCYDNRLTSLAGCPEVVRGMFDCSTNQIMSLEFCPKIVGIEFVCNENPLLGDAQKINNFDEILRIQEKTLIELEKENLEQKITQNEMISKKFIKFN